MKRGSLLIHKFRCTSKIEYCIRNPLKLSQTSTETRIIIWKIIQSLICNANKIVFIFCANKVVYVHNNCILPIYYEIHLIYFIFKIYMTLCLYVKIKNIKMIMAELINILKYIEYIIF